MDYNSAQQFVYSFADYEKTPVPHAAANYDLRRVFELLALLGNPQLKTPSVHVTGTKGKGSTSIMIASVLQASGYLTGLYTSPHLLAINERIRIGNQAVTNEEFVELTDLVKPAVEAVNRKATYGRLTTFEVLTVMAFAGFARKNVDFQVLEVGLGGTYDATNVIPKPEVAVITSISYDHVEILGKTLTEIAGEKCGIIKNGGTVVSSPQEPEAEAVITRVCNDRSANLIQVGRDVTWKEISHDIAGQIFEVNGLNDVYRLSIPLLGRHQLTNAAVAVAALEILSRRGFKISPEQIKKGLEYFVWPARFQIVSREPVTVLDGAHNADSAKKLKEAIKYYLEFNNNRSVLVIGASTDKNIAAMARELAPVFTLVIATRSQNPRAMGEKYIADEFSRLGAQVLTAENVDAALQQAKDLAGKDGLICVTGSLFVVAEALKMVQK